MRTSLLAAGLFAALSFSAVAQAQTPSPAPAAPTAPAPGGFTDAELTAFGSAMTEVAKLNAEYSPKMVGADGPTKISVQKEMIAKMGAAVAASGLTPQKYNEISAAVSKDPALRQHLTEVLNGPPAPPAA